jgi:hypothetical protein
MMAFFEDKFLSNGPTENEFPVMSDDENGYSFRNAVPAKNTSDIGSISNTEKVKSTAIPATGCGGLQGCEAPRQQHCLDNWFTDGSEVVSLMHRMFFTPQGDSCYSFLQYICIM